MYSGICTVCCQVNHSINGVGGATRINCYNIYHNFSWLWFACKNIPANANALFYFGKRYIDMIHYLENFTDYRKPHNLQKFDKNYNALVTVDPKARRHPCVQAKKFLAIRVKKRDRCRYKNVPRNMPL